MFVEWVSQVLEVAIGDIFDYEPIDGENALPARLLDPHGAGPGEVYFVFHFYQATEVPGAVDQKEQEDAAVVGTGLTVCFVQAFITQVGGRPYFIFYRGPHVDCIV